MNVHKFKLLDRGDGGMEITAIESMQKGKVIISDEVSRKRNLPVDKPIVDKIQKLKYFMLNLTRHWIPIYNNYFDMDEYVPLPVNSKDEMKKSEEVFRNLWNDSFVTGMIVKETGFQITGRINTYEEKVLGFATPFVSADDDVGFYEVVMDIFDEIAKDISDYYTKNILPIHSEATIAEIEEQVGKKVEEMTTEQFEESVMQRFAEKGLIILGGPDFELPKKTKKEGETEIHENSGSIDGENLKEAEVEKKPADSTLASDKDWPLQEDGDDGKKQPSGEDLAALEHSENMGGESDQEPWVE